MSANIYSQPEKFGLVIVGDVAKSPSYDFDIFVVFRKPDGSLWYDEDSGCSCPIPFEDEGIDDLAPYSDAALDAWRSKYSADDADAPRLSDVEDLKAKCR